MTPSTWRTTHTSGRYPKHPTIRRGHRKLRPAGRLASFSSLEMNRYPKAGLSRQASQSALRGSRGQSPWEAACTSVDREAHGPTRESGQNHWQGKRLPGAGPRLPAQSMTALGKRNEGMT